MSASQAHALSAIAFQLAATLESYEEDVDRMLRAPFDPEQYQRVSRHVDNMRLYASALPALSVAWVEVLIRHFELTHGVWRVQQEVGDDVDLKLLQAQLSEAVRRLARKCTQLMPRA
jgi:hypothetical protein